MFLHILLKGAFKKSSLHTGFVEVVAACTLLKKNFKVEEYRFVCPLCDTPSSTIVQGNELTTYKIVLEEPSYAEVNQ